MNIRIIAALYVALFTLPLKAQVIDLTAYGTVTTTYNSSVEVGSPFTYDYVIDEDASSTARGSTYATYLDSSSDASGTETFGGYTFTQTDYSGAAVYNDYSEGYGYNLTNDSPNTNGYYQNASLLLISYTHPSVATDTSLSSIGQFPISDFNGYTSFDFVSVDEEGDSEVFGNITSYTVQIIPEPSESYLFGGGLFLLALRRFTSKSHRPKKSQAP